MDFEVSGYRMHYGLFGDSAGEPLLWLHGWTGSGEDWKYIFKDPPAGFRLIGPDMRGNGASTGFEGKHSFRESAQDMFALLDHLGVCRAKAIGLSGGGITLLHMATQQPDRIEAMITISAPPYFPAQARAIQRQFSFASLSEAEKTAMRERSKGGQKQIEWLMEQTQAMAATYDDVNFTPPVLGTITARTLIIFGTSILCIQCDWPSSCVNRSRVHRSGWYQTQVMVRYSDLMLCGLVKRRMLSYVGTGQEKEQHERFPAIHEGSSESHPTIEPGDSRSRRLRL